jgi:hypothetical protein
MWCKLLYKEWETRGMLRVESPQVTDIAVVLTTVSLSLSFSFFFFIAVEG